MTDVLFCVKGRYPPSVEDRSAALLYDFSIIVKYDTLQFIWALMSFRSILSALGPASLVSAVVGT
jgi:hypothetical protein